MSRSLTGSVIYGLFTVIQLQRIARKFIMGEDCHAQPYQNTLTALHIHQ
jgi:hypothetical protein